jgi:ATP-dependent RNA helicase DDX10/DBP4
VDRFAESLGLPGTPKIKFLNKEIAKKKKNASRTVEAAQAEVEKEREEEESEESSAGESDGGESSEEENGEGVQTALSKVRFSLPILHDHQLTFLLAERCPNQIRPHV